MEQSKLLEQIMNAYSQVTGSSLSESEKSQGIVSIQHIQTAHRLKLIAAWKIEKGARILEIGCGQGDTTLALAYAAGENGFVHGIDIAPPDYGAPVSLGKSREILKQTPAGNRIQMDFSYNFLLDPPIFPEKSFDYVVLSHSLWYLASDTELVRILQKARKFAGKLCIAEWCPEITLPEQLPHYKAASIQAMIGCYKEDNDANIRTMLYPSEIKAAVTNSGWKITNSDTIYSPDLQDGFWEVDGTVHVYAQDIDALKMPGKLKKLLHAQVNELQSILQETKREDIRPMPVFYLTADADRREETS